MRNNGLASFRDVEGFGRTNGLLSLLSECVFISGWFQLSRSRRLESAKGFVITPPWC